MNSMCERCVESRRMRRRKAKEARAARKMAKAEAVAWIANSENETFGPLCEASELAELIL